MDKNISSINTGLNVLNNITKRSDLFVAIAAIGGVLMLIIPVSPIFLDFFLLLNLSMAFLIILSTLYVRKPSDFSSFPTLILLTTVFSLALNVSSTRLILTEGQAGNLIEAFGNFVVSGNLVVGLIIFIILIAIQFLVITKGATRVSEVAARFSLDSMPGKQLAIDADLNSGAITEEEAQKRRTELTLETGFYGSMDGATKFVSGNVQMALVVLLVDIIGGIIIGSMNGMGIGAAADRYITLTVGDGLVSQIPALLISVATGIIVTRNSSQDEKFASAVSTQLVMLPKTLYITGGVIIAMGLLPGFPLFLCIFIGGILIGSAYLMTQAQLQEEEQIKKDKQLATQNEDSQPTIHDILHVDPMSMEIGFRLIPLVDKSQGGTLLDRIKLMRKHIGLDLGILVPPIRITDASNIDAQNYIIKIRGIEIGRGNVYVNRLLAMNPKLDISLIEGIESPDPVFNLPAKWIATEDAAKAEKLGFDVFDPSSAIATHITELIKRNSFELLTRQDVQNMMDALKKEYPTLVDDALKQSNIGEIHKILQMLLKEKVKIRNMIPILETIADYRKVLPHLDALTEQIREVLSKQIVADSHISQQNTIKSILLNPQWEQTLLESLEESPQGYNTIMSSEQMNDFVHATGRAIEAQLREGRNPVVLCSKRIRRLVRELLAHTFPNTPVLAYSEIPATIQVEQLGLIS